LPGALLIAVFDEWAGSVDQDGGGARLWSRERQEVRTALESDAMLSARGRFDPCKFSVPSRCGPFPSEISSQVCGYMSFNCCKEKFAVNALLIPWPGRRNRKIRL